MDVDKVANILNLMDRASLERILDYIMSKDPDLAREIRSTLFRFEDLFRLEDRDLKILLQEVPNPLLPIALKGVDKRLLARIINNMSARVGAILTEELTMSGPKSRKEVDTAQQTITAIARLLVDQGKIFVPWLDKENKMIY
jgi:flagellar motor switch protein FliG